jgi:hypothetical protein
MPKSLTEGMIFVSEGTELPPDARLDSKPYVEGWKFVENIDSYGLDRQMYEAGLTFFRQPNAVEAIALGMNERETVRRALQRILAKVNLEQFNSLEITHVDTRRFLGMCYASVAGRPRYIQANMFPFRRAAA